MNIDHHGKAEGACFKSEEDEDYGNKRSDHSIDNSCMYGTGRKKLRLTKDQSSYLEESFRRHPTLNPVPFFAALYIFHFFPSLSGSLCC
jgi:homeobox-leucine zipper protein